MAQEASTHRDSHSGQPLAAQLQLVQGGEDFFHQLDALIRAAQHEIHLQTYILDDDSTGKAVMQALTDAVRRGVRVTVLLDAFGSGALPNHAIATLRAAGLQIRRFAPWLSWHSLHLGRRLHHKVFVADRRHILIGGINIADKYRGTPTDRAWLDYAVRIESDTIGARLATLCANLFDKRHILPRKPVTAPLENPMEQVTILLNDYLLRRTDIQKAYRKAVRVASRELTIIGTYFLPGARLSQALQRAAKRGVQVRLVLSGTSDVPIVRRATTHLYQRLMRKGIHLFEWPHSVLHGKAIEMDGLWTSIGSFNLNALSAYGSIEMNVAVESPAFALHTRENFDQVIDQCNPITPETYSTRDAWHQRLLNWTCYHLVNLSLTLLTYTSHKRIWKPHRSPS